MATTPAVTNSTRAKPSHIRLPENPTAVTGSRPSIPMNIRSTMWAKFIRMLASAAGQASCQML
jgi:hypothetical protein